MYLNRCYKVRTFFVINTIMANSQSWQNRTAALFCSSSSLNHISELMRHISSSFDRKAKFLSTFWFQLITFTTHYKWANWRDVVVFTWLLNYNFSPVSCSLDNSNTIYYLEVTVAVHISSALYFSSVVFCEIDLTQMIGLKR